MRYVNKSWNTKENKSSVILSVVIMQNSDPVPAGFSQLKFQINNSNVEGGSILGSTIRIKFSHSVLKYVYFKSILNIPEFY